MSRCKTWPPEEPPPPYRYKIVSTEPTDIGRLDQNGTRITQGRGSPRHLIMQVFDQLPPSVRAALAASNHDWAPHWADIWITLFPAQAIVARIEKADREEALRREMQLLRGEG